MKLKHTRIKLRLKLRKLYLDIRHSHLKDIRNVLLLYVKKLPNVIHLKNLVLFNTILATIAFVMFFQRFSAIRPYYEKAIPSFGGYYREGVIGDIEKINPLFSTNIAEAQASKLVFSGLTRTLPNNEVVPDLAESWRIEDGGNVYIFKLKNNLKWHDDKPLTVNDVLYTINLIQNPDTKTNQINVWKGVIVQTVSENEIKFTLNSPYSNFLNVASQPILPKHLLEEIEPKNIKVAEFNKNPIGSGPYRFVRFDQSANDTEVLFESFDDFAIQKPYIRQIKLHTYDSFDSLYNGLIRKQIDGITEIPFDKVDKINQISNLATFKMYLPRYQMLAFNLKNETLADKNVRLAISKTINRDKIIQNVISGQGLSVFSPILPGQPGYDSKYRAQTIDAAGANDLLETAGWLKQADGKRLKGDKQLTTKLVIIDDEESIKTGELIRDQLKDIGINVEIVKTDLSNLQSNYIRPRNFDMILVGQGIGLSADLYSLWHSSQAIDPGLNITGLSDPKVDKLLEQSRRTSDEVQKSVKLRQAQEALLEQAPAVFLYNPIYTFALSKNVKGYSEGRLNDSIDHMNSIYLWYTKVKRERI